MADIPERTPADVAMKLLQMADEAEFCVAVLATKDKEGGEDGVFQVEWAGDMNRYTLIGILQRAILLLGGPEAEAEEEEEDG